MTKCVVDNILFICKENRYRSQIAEAIFNNLTTEYHAISASGAEPAQKVSDDAIRLLKKVYGIDMGGQKPKRLTRPMLDNASKIIILCDPKDCILIPKNYKAEHWNIAKMENMSEKDKIKELGKLHQKIMRLIRAKNIQI